MSQYIKNIFSSFWPAPKPKQSWLADLLGVSDKHVNMYMAAMMALLGISYIGIFLKRLFVNRGSCRQVPLGEGTQAAQAPQAAPATQAAPSAQ